MTEKYYVILSRNNTYCGTLNEEDYKKFKNKYTLELKEICNRTNIIVVKHKKYNSTKLKYMIWGIWEKIENDK